MRRLRLFLIAAALLAGPLLAPVAYAAEATKDKGLLISPIRSYLTMDAGDTKTRSFTVANLTSKPIVVTLSVEQFSIADYTYDFTFNQPKNTYVKLVENRVELKPYESHEVPYAVTLPTTAAPGGIYYSLFASANLSSDGFSGTVRAASLLYLTVNGDLSQTGTIVKSSVPWIVVTPQVPYTIEVKNTGNVHYFAHFSGSVAGAFYQSSPATTSQLLMPQSTRRVKNTLPAPLLPGIYKINYGYTSDSGQKVMRSQYFAFLPPWFLAFAAVAGYVFGRKYLRQRKSEAHSSTDTDATGS
jgi:hypothetical protein